jgi:anti-sigma regulatory factor (Ser/Thr protein kinase)
MTTIRVGGEKVRKFILSQVQEHPGDIVRITMNRFGYSRQAVQKHIQRLVSEGALTPRGTTRSRQYFLAPLVSIRKSWPIGPELDEGLVWSKDIQPELAMLPENVLNIWHYGFTEMFNNVVDHSNGTEVFISLERTAATTTMDVIDDGVGIFKKIQAALGLADARHSVLELAKGKFTTDPDHHSGEGIFFASRMFDDFIIRSGDVFFNHAFAEDEDWILKTPTDRGGTHVSMVLNNHTSRSTRKVYAQFTSDDDFGFARTVVPVKLLEYGDDNLISRSQAKRLLSRFDCFKVVMLDFTGVATVGQAFADEVFRVFALQHPEVQLIPTHANTTVNQMIMRALALGRERRGVTP